MQPDILNVLLTLHQGYIEALAAAWLNDGAGSFGLWQKHDSQPLICWPERAASLSPNLTAPIDTGTQVLGYLGALAGDTPQNRRRLESEAGLLARLAQIEDDVQTMTSDLISGQDQLLALYDLAETSRSRADLDDMLSALVYEIARLVKSDDAFLLVTWRGRARLAQASDLALDKSILVDLAEQVQSSGQRMLLKGRSPFLPASVTNMLIEPMRVRGASLAVIGLLNKPHGFSSPDIKLTHGIAEQLGAQLENTLLHEDTIEQMRMQTEMQLAQQVQTRLLPQKAPHVAGIDVYAGTKPALQVGGDFFDFIPLTHENSFIFSVGDVSGKGLPAALLMAMTRTVLRSKARMLEQPRPQEILGLTNQDMYDDFTEVSMFATIFVGQYYPNSNQVMFSNAGHSPVIYRPANGSAQIVEAEAPAVGVLNINLTENRVLDFNPGDVLVVATDGFNEARSADGEMFGYQRLMDLVDTLADKPSSEIASALYDAVNTHEGNRSPEDDQTIIVLRRLSDG